jgi:proto-oncogene tyrosine-protein kinase ROS
MSKKCFHLQFRVALMINRDYEEWLYSEQSVIISTLPSGRPSSEPEIVRAVAVDHTRISVSWEPGPFPNGPILSYVLQITDLDPSGYSALKVHFTNNFRALFSELFSPSLFYFLPLIFAYFCQSSCFFRNIH